MTSNGAMLGPVFVHVLLVYVLLLVTGRGRTAAVRAGEVRLEDIAVDSSRWPDRLRKPANNYQSQFELPVLFYALVTLLIATDLADGISLILAWAFVASRLVHSFIHLGSNHPPHRLAAFAAGFAALAIMWLWFALRLYVGWVGMGVSKPPPTPGPSPRGGGVQFAPPSDPPSPLEGEGRGGGAAP